jgi:pre-mRNA 3'-end-processing factor FIP1
MGDGGVEAQTALLRETLANDPTDNSSEADRATADVTTPTTTSEMSQLQEGGGGATTGGGEHQGGNGEGDLYRYEGEDQGAGEGDDLEDDDDELPDIVLDTEKAESGSTTPHGGRAGRGGMMGRVNLTWNKPGLQTSSPGSASRSSSAGGSSGGGGGPTAGRFAPGQRNPLEIDIDALEDKPWRKPGADPSDYFNYGFTEESWRAYCAKQIHMRQEMSMQGKIRVWEGHQKTTPERPTDALPPELLAFHQPSDLQSLPLDNSRPRFAPPGGGRRDRPPIRSIRADNESVVQVLSGDNGPEDYDPHSSSSSPFSHPSHPVPSLDGEAIPTSISDQEGMPLGMFPPPMMGVPPRDIGRGPPMFYPPKGRNMPPFPGGRYPLPGMPPSRYPPPGLGGSRGPNHRDRRDERYPYGGGGYAPPYDRDSRRSSDENTGRPDGAEGLEAEDGRELSPRERERREREKEHERDRDRDHWEREREERGRKRELEREMERGGGGYPGGGDRPEKRRRYDSESSYREKERDPRERERGREGEDTHRSGKRRPESAGSKKPEGSSPDDDPARKRRR